MSDNESNETERLSFKHEWNNFSIYCWTLMEKSLFNLSEEERTNFKKNIANAKTSLDKVKVVIDNKVVLEYLKNHVEYLNNRNLIDHKKDTKFAHNCKKIADVYFGKNRFQKALKFYSKAILFFDNERINEVESNDESTRSDTATNTSIQDETVSLSTLYICRAKVLVKLEKLNDACSDFMRAVSLEPEIKNDIIEIDNLSTYYKPNKVDFKLSSNNSKLDGASNSVRMEYCDDKGRLIYSERQIEEGEILFMEEPYVHWLRPTYYEMYCHQCLKRLNKYVYIPCDHCTEIRFCSNECKEIAWKRYHETECKYLKLLKKWPSGHMALRLILRDGLNNALEENRKPNIPLNEWPKLGFKANYSSIRSLTGENNFTDGDYYCPLVVGCVLIALLFEINNEIKKSDLEQFSALLIKSIMQILENTFMIYDYDIRAIENDDFTGEKENDKNASSSNNLTLNQKSKTSKFHQMSSTSFKVGVGLYSATSLIPHSCDNNSNKYFFGSSILIVAAKPIDANDEVNIEYGVHYKMNSLKYRKDYLKNNFGFDCKCYACVSSYENECLSYKCLKCFVGALISNKDQTNYCLNCGAKDIDLSSVNLLIKKAEQHFYNGIEAYKQNNLKRAETELRTGEKICSKVYYNDIKLQFIKCELSHLYAIKKNFALAYHYLFETLPSNRSLYGEYSIEVLTNHIELASLAADCIENLTNTGFSVKQTSQRLLRQLLVKMTNKASKQINSRNLDLISFEEIDKKLTNCDEIMKWKIVFKRHYLVVFQMYAMISKREAKIASEEAMNSLNKLAHLKQFHNSIET